ncbi:hypothetical protein ASF24_09650 [Methylobacterium sp. Leaf86]|nr:hypothetical protein ASF24_09650 [Methylobacterium sp. Leaf86]
MILTMKRHATRADSGHIQFKLRVPADVSQRVRGRVVTVELPASVADPACAVSFRLGEFAKVSLRTRDAATADVRRLAVIASLARLYSAIRTGPVPLTPRQVTALAGECYRHLIVEHGDDPGTPQEWESWKAFTRAALEGRIDGVPPIALSGRTDEQGAAVVIFGAHEGDALTEGVNELPRTDETEALEQRCGRLAFWTLGRQGIEVDSRTHLALLREIARAALQAGWQLKRHASGDFREDPDAKRFPAFQEKAAGITLSAIFERWERETKPSGSTVTTWKGIVASLKASVGHEDAARITDHDVVKWKDSRVAAGRSAKTVNDSDLACIRALYRFGIANKLVTANPADGVKVSAKAKAGTSKLPYSDDEIARLLQAAERETLAYRRWLPLLLVTTGARVGEMAQLSGDRVRTVDGVLCLVIEPASDGGSLKNATSERTVPMHPALIQSGFIEFVKGKGDGPLFYNRAKSGSARHASVGPRNHLSSWIRELPGFDDERKSPAHATRHWWKSVASRNGLPDSIADHIQGHAAASVAGRYRHFGLEQLAMEIAKMPVPSVSSEPTGTMPVPRMT